MDNVFSRQDIWTLEEQQLWHPIILAYALAVREMQRLPANNPSSWEYQSAVHGTNENIDQFRAKCQHATWLFLPWHRMHLYWFEQIIRKIIQELKEIDDDTKHEWALPYWNYWDTRPMPTPPPRINSLPPTFREVSLPNGDRNPLFVPGRRLQGAAVIDPRRVSARFAFSTNVFSQAGAGLPPGFGGPPVGLHHGFDGQHGLLERTPHDDVHGAVGGLMNHPNTAALDPIFWLHHANIDRLWDLWLLQDTNRSNPTDSAWLTQRFHFHDENGADVTDLSQPIRPQSVLKLDQLGYKYADPLVPNPVPAAAPLEPAMQPEPPSERPAELVGATAEPMTLTGDAATVRFGISTPAGPLAAGEGVPSRVYLNVEDIKAAENPGLSYGVYVNVPDDDEDPTNDAHYVGNVTFFGIEVSEDLDRDHPGDHGTFRQAFDITDLYTRLRDEGRWNEEQIKVTFQPLGVLPPPGAGPASAEPEETPPVTIGRVSIFYQ